MPSGTSLKAVVDFLLEVAIGRAARHGADGAHAAVGLVGAGPGTGSDLARAFVGAGEQASRSRQQLAPPASALAMIAEKLMPPSAMIGTPCLSASSAQDMTAASCGTPTPATMRVVQIEPGPMPTLTQSAPASISASVASRVATLPAMMRVESLSRLTPLDSVQHALGMTMRGIDDEEIDACIDERHGALDSRHRPHRWRRRRAGGPAHPCTRVGVKLGLLDIFHRDEADTAAIVIDDQQLFDAVGMQQALGIGLADAVAHGDQALVRHQFADGLVRVGGEADVGDW